MLPTHLQKIVGHFSSIMFHIQLICVWKLMDRGFTTGPTLLWKSQFLLESSRCLWLQGRFNQRDGPLVLLAVGKQHCRRMNQHRNDGLASAIQLLVHAIGKIHCFRYSEKERNNYKASKENTPSINDPKNIQPNRLGTKLSEGRENTQSAATEEIHAAMPAGNHAFI